MIWTTFGCLYDAIIRQYFKAAYDVIPLPWQHKSSLKRASKTQFLLIIFKTNLVTC